MSKPISVLSILTVFLSLAVANAFQVTGATGGINNETGQRPFRLEFRTFQNTGAAFDLYILALQQFQAEDQDEKLSYFQVTGIHGRPYIDWDGVTGDPNNGGYCTHSSILFLPWHRPYMALFEQIIWDNAQTIAATYPESSRAEYTSAALTLRIPYWDWATFPTMPDLLSDLQISVNTPTGLQTIANPLQSYHFHPRPDSSSFPLGEIGSEYPNTVRYPDANGSSQPEPINEELQYNAASLHDRTCNVLQYADYGPFSNTGWTSDRGDDYDSVEAIHNDIHSYVGSDGHMTYVPYAAFDPIFFIHHAQVDRLFAIWQAIHPDSYVVPELDYYGTYTIPGNTLEDNKTGLTPFHIPSTNNNNEMHTSTTARALKSFGYSYPELIDWGGISAAELRNNTIAAVNTLYCATAPLASSSSPVQRLLRRRQDPVVHPPRAGDVAHLPDVPSKKEGRGRQREKGFMRSNPLPLPAPPYRGGGSSTHHREWFLNMRVHKHELGTPFTIHYFLGAVTTDADPRGWATDANHVGSHSMFTGRDPNVTNTAGGGKGGGEREGEGEEEGKWSHAQLPLTRGLLDRTGDLRIGQSIEYLKGNLHWRVQLPDKSAVPAASLTSLSLIVLDREVDSSSTSPNGTWGARGKMVRRFSLVGG